MPDRGSATRRAPGEATFAWLTPGDPAAIAVLRAPPVATLIDRPLPEIGRARFARLLDRAGAVVDEVVVARVADDGIEIMCHGGVGLRQAVALALTAHGLVQVAPGPPITAAERRWDALAAAPSPAAVRWLLAHDGDSVPPFPAAFLRRTPTVLITGPANAGKSTLLNAWCGHARALVAAQPGTTRDLVTADTLVHGWRLRLIDSAGLRPTSDAIEAAGQALVDVARAEVDLVLFLHGDDPAGGNRSQPGDVVVAAKADLTATPPAGLWWSALGAHGRSREDLLAGLGAAVLDRLRLPIALPYSAAC